MIIRSIDERGVVSLVTANKNERGTFLTMGRKDTDGSWLWYGSLPDGGTDATLRDGDYLPIYTSDKSVKGHDYKPIKFIRSNTTNNKSVILLLEVELTEYPTEIITSNTVRILGYGIVNHLGNKVKQPILELVSDGIITVRRMTEVDELDTRIKFDYAATKFSVTKTASCNESA